MKTRTTLTLVSLTLFSLLIAWAGTGLAQQGQDPELVKHARWITVHDYGVQVKLLPPDRTSTVYRLQVIDLQGDVPGLRADLAPTDATVAVQGMGQLTLQSVEPHILSADIPLDWALAAAQGDSECVVMHNQKQLVGLQLNSLLL